MAVATSLYELRKGTQPGGGSATCSAFENFSFTGDNGNFAGLGSINNSGNQATTYNNFGIQTSGQNPDFAGFSNGQIGGLGGVPQTGAPSIATTPVLGAPSPAVTTQPQQVTPSNLGGTPILGAASTRGWFF